MKEENKSEATVPSGPNEICIGPNSNYWLALAFSNLGFYLGIGIVLVAIAPTFVDLPETISDYFTSEIRTWTAIGGMVLAGICALKGIILAWTTEYVFDQAQNTLFLKRGLFSKDTNAINMRLIYDCDIHQSPTELVFGAGTLLLKESDEKIFNVKFVDAPIESRKLIMANSGASSARMISTIS